MIFKTLVECILKRQRDSDDDLALNALSALTQEIRTDLMQAFAISRPLVDKHPALFRNSRSFLDFLIRVSHLPLHTEHLSESREASGFPDDGFPNNELSECRRKLTRCQTELEECREELKERSTDSARAKQDEADLEECRKELEDCRRTSETLLENTRERHESEAKALREDKEKLARLLRECQDELRELKRRALAVAESRAEADDFAQLKTALELDKSALEQRLAVTEKEKEQLGALHSKEKEDLLNYIREISQFNANLQQHYLELNNAAGLVAQELERVKQQNLMLNWSAMTQSQNFLNTLDRIRAYTEKIELENKNLKELEGRCGLFEITEVSDSTMTDESPKQLFLCESNMASEEMEAASADDSEKIMKVVRNHYGCDDGDISLRIREDLDRSKRLEIELKKREPPGTSLDDFLEKVSETEFSLNSILRASEVNLQNLSSSSAAQEVVKLLENCNGLVRVFPPLETADRLAVNDFYSTVTRVAKEIDLPFEDCGEEWFRHAIKAIETMSGEVGILKSLTNLEPELSADKCKWRGAFVARYNKLKDCAASLTGLDGVDGIDSVMNQLKLELPGTISTRGAWLFQYLKHLKDQKTELDKTIESSDYKIRDLEAKLEDDRSRFRNYFRIVDLNYQEGNEDLFLTKVEDIKKRNYFNFYLKVKEELNLSDEMVSEEEVLNALKRTKGKMKRSVSLTTLPSEQTQKKQAVPFYSDIELQNLISALYKEYFLLKWNYLNVSLPKDAELKQRIQEKIDILGQISEGNVRSSQLVKIFTQYVQYDLISLKETENIPQTFTNIVSKDELLSKCMEDTQKYLELLLSGTEKDD